MLYYCYLSQQPKQEKEILSLYYWEYQKSNTVGLWDFSLQILSQTPTTALKVKFLANILSRENN